LVEEIPQQLSASSVPPQVVAGFAASGNAAISQLSGVGDLGQAILAAAPAAARAQLEPFVPAIVDAIHRAFSIATASIFTFSIAAAVVVFIVVAFLRETPAGAAATEDETLAA
jgi:hypothetical protein